MMASVLVPKGAGAKVALPRPLCSVSIQIRNQQNRSLDVICRSAVNRKKINVPLKTNSTSSLGYFSQSAGKVHKLRSPGHPSYSAMCLHREWHAYTWGRHTCRWRVSVERARRVGWWWRRRCPATREHAASTLPVLRDNNDPRTHNNQPLLVSAQCFEQANNNCFYTWMPQHCWYCITV